MDEQIIKSLIELYKENGIDVTAVIGDPIFEKLPLPSQIQLLKSHAEEITSQTAPSLTKHDIKRVLKDAAKGAGIGAAGGLIGLTRSAPFIFGPNKQSLGAAVGKAALAAGAFGLLGSAVRTASALKARKDIHYQAEMLRDDPSDSNAIKLLSLNKMRPISLRKTDILDRVYTMVDGREFDTIMAAPTISAHHVFATNSDKPRFGDVYEMPEFKEKGDRIEEETEKAYEGYLSKRKL